MNDKDNIKNVKPIGALLHKAGKRPADRRTYFALPNAREVLWYSLCEVLGEAAWLPEYDEVALWLADNKGKGLLCMGDCGRGKTVITQKVLPMLFDRMGKVLHCHTAIDMLTEYGNIAKFKHICIDDMGTEPNAKDYGVVHDYMSELVDLAEREEKLLVISTNLNKDEIIQRYGIRTYDRLRSITHRVVFTGDSLRDEKVRASLING